MANEFFQLFQLSEVKQISETCCFNTDSMFDLLTGDTRRGVDGKWYLNGGLGPAIAGILGRAGMFKSTFAASLISRMSAIYQTQMFVVDSEDAISRNKSRIARMAGDHSDEFGEQYIVTLDGTTEYDLAKLLELIKEIGEKKKSLGKDAMFTTPFIDPHTNKPIKIYRPTPIFIDSLTEAHGTAEATMVGDSGLDDAKTKTAYMLDANQKTLFLRQAKRYAAEYGLELVCTAHYGPKLNLGYLPPPKALQFMSQDESPKGVGSKFNFLTSPQALIQSCSLCKDDAKQCKYKLGPDTSPTDLSEIVVQIQRCKNNASGLMHPFVVSQENGLLTETTDYNYLRANKGFSMIGNNVTHQSVFLPKVNMTRNSFRTTCQENPQLIRALQLGSQLLYIKTNWNASGWPFALNVEPQKLVDALMSDKNKYTVDRVLNSRGFWLPEEIKDDREYLSVFDVLEQHSVLNKA